LEFSMRSSPSIVPAIDRDVYLVLDDVSEGVARELRQRCADQDRELPEFLEVFVERHVMEA